MTSRCARQLGWKRMDKTRVALRAYGRKGKQGKYKTDCTVRPARRFKNWSENMKGQRRAGRWARDLRASRTKRPIAIKGLRQMQCYRGSEEER